jgi:hypothetical protein
MRAQSHLFSVAICPDRTEQTKSMSSSDFCVIQLQGWSTWWQETRSFRPKVYISIVLFFLSAALAYPIARSVFFVLRRATPKRYV